MEIINGWEALRTMRDISRVGGTFKIIFFKYSRRKKEASTELRTLSDCKVRKPMPHDKFSIDGANLFLFESNGIEKMCYKYLIRYVGFPADDYKLKEIKWFKDE